MAASENSWEATDRAQGRYFLWLDLAAVLFAVAAITTATGIGYGVSSVTGAASQLILLGLLRRRRDEFAEHCWRRATHATFTALLLVPLIYSFGSGLYEGFTGGPPSVGAPTGLAEMPSLNALVFVLLATFFAVFEWTRFRGVAA